MPSPNDENAALAERMREHWSAAVVATIDGDTEEAAQFCARSNRDKDALLARLAEADEAVEELAGELADERTLHQQMIKERNRLRDALLVTQAACSFYRGEADIGLEEIGKIVSDGLAGAGQDAAAPSGEAT